MRQQAASFSLGAVVATANAVADIPLLAIHAALDRHAAGDWGDLCEEDGLLSAYETTGGTTFWVITEHDRSITTVLLPTEY